MPHLYRASASPRHLRRRSTGHLALRHPGYTIAASAQCSFYGKADTVERIPWTDPNIDPQVIAAIGAQLNAALASMVSSASVGYGEINGVYSPAGGAWYSISAEARSGGNVYSVTANNSAPFGAPLCDLTVTVYAPASGSTGSPLVGIGAGSSTPSLSTDPSGWPVDQTISSTTTLYDFELKPYLWLTCWFTNPSSINDVSLHRLTSVSISAGNIRYFSES